MCCKTFHCSAQLYTRCTVQAKRSSDRPDDLKRAQPWEECCQWCDRALVLLDRRAQRIAPSDSLGRVDAKGAHTPITCLLCLSLCVHALQMGAVALPLGSGFAVGLMAQGDVNGW